VPLNSRVSFSKNSPVYRLLTLQLGGSSKERDERVHSTRLRGVLRAGVRCLRPIRPIRGLYRLRSISATSMPRFDGQVASDNCVISLHNNVHEEVCFSSQTGGLLAGVVAQ
jgi:hypothetical protein